MSRATSKGYPKRIRSCQTGYEAVIVDYLFTNPRIKINCVFRGFGPRGVAVLPVVRWGRNFACRSQDKFGAGARFFVRGRAASLPTGQSSQRCAEWRIEPGT